MLLNRPSVHFSSAKAHTKDQFKHRFSTCLPWLLVAGASWCKACIPTYRHSLLVKEGRTQKASARLRKNIQVKSPVQHLRMHWNALLSHLLYLNYPCNLQQAWVSGCCPQCVAVPVVGAVVNSTTSFVGFCGEPRKVTLKYLKKTQNIQNIQRFTMKMLIDIQYFLTIIYKIGTYIYDIYKYIIYIYNRIWSCNDTNDTCLSSNIKKKESRLWGSIPREPFELHLFVYPAAVEEFPNLSDPYLSNLHWG